jgi:hypothetical protein
MDFRKLISDVLTGNTRDLGKRFSLLSRKMKRLAYQLSHKRLIGAALQDIPVIINNRNRYGYLLKLIAWLEKNGMTNIIILDNDSTYPPLLEYYKSTRYKVFLTGRNVGPFAIWQIPAMDHYVTDYYIYTDADVVPDESTGFECIRLMYERLRGDITIDKIGLALRIDNLPDHFKLKGEVIDWESQFWKVRDGRNFWRAKVDTTFALYAPYAKGGGDCKALRTDFPHVAQHLPWYENSDVPQEEDEYYRAHSEPSNSHWTKLTAQ